MSNALYGKGKEKLLAGSINIGSDTIKCALVSSAYTPNLTTHEFYSDISANVLNTPQALASKTTTLGVVNAANITFTAVTAGATASYLAIYKDTGTAGTSPLIALIDTITGFPLATNGGDVAIQWDTGSNHIFSL